MQRNLEHADPLIDGIMFILRAGVVFSCGSVPIPVFESWSKSSMTLAQDWITV